MYPVGGGDGGEGGRLGQEDVVPADWRMQRLPWPQQRPEDLVKVPPPEFLEVPLRRSKKHMKMRCDCSSASNKLRT